MDIKDITVDSKFCDYFRVWIEVYKEGAIREATMSKYRMTLKWIEKLIPDVNQLSIL